MRTLLSIRRRGASRRLGIRVARAVRGHRQALPSGGVGDGPYGTADDHAHAPLRGLL